VFVWLRQLEEDPKVLSAGILMAQPYMDVPDLGWSILVYTDNDPPLAESLAGELADMCWSKRESLRSGQQFCLPQQVLAEALACDGQPVIVADGPDATNSGAPGDSTYLLQALAGEHIPGGALTTIVDPQAVAIARKAGAGGRFACEVGGRRDTVFSKPLLVEGEVCFIKPLQYTLSGHMADNLPVDMGVSAGVRIADVTVLFTERPGPGSSPMMYRCVGLEPRDFKIVIVKSPAGFRADYGPFAAGVILTAYPACANPVLEDLPYQRISRPLWPLDAIRQWRDVPWCQAASSHEDVAR